MTWFFLAANSKISEERDKLQKELLGTKELEFEDLENYQPMYITSNKKYAPEKSPQV